MKFYTKLGFAVATMLFSISNSYAVIQVANHSFKDSVYGVKIDRVSIGYRLIYDGSGKVTSKRQYAYVQSKTDQGENFEVYFDGEDFQTGLALINAKDRHVIFALKPDEKFPDQMNVTEIDIHNK